VVGASPKGEAPTTAREPRGRWQGLPLEPAKGHFGPPAGAPCPVRNGP
jgi:hypothetical protein